jgi:hypothetical protein
VLGLNQCLLTLDPSKVTVSSSAAAPAGSWTSQDVTATGASTTSVLFDACLCCVGISLQSVGPAGK